MSRFAIQISWDDVPHLDEAAKKVILDAYMPHERDARSRGIPSLGAGAIYPIAESDLVCDPFEFPLWYKHVYALDVGWNRTAAIWGALDPETDVLYCWNEYYRGSAEPPIHAAAIKARGLWIPGVVDPAARGRGQKDGEQLLLIYQSLGLNLVVADNAVEAGIYRVWTRMSTGRLKVFKTMQNFLAEFRIYRRDENGKVHKDMDHLMDSCFAPETIVWTADGPQPISALVGTTGYVRSIGGGFEAYKNCRRTRENAPLVTVHFDDGSRLRCTRDHKFMTINGWVDAIDLKGEVCLRGIPHTIQDAPCSPQQSSTAQPRNFWARNIINAADTFATRAQSCTASFGSITTIGRASQAAYMSTTLIMTSPITTQTISPWSNWLRTRATINAATSEQSPLRPWLRRLSGTGVTKERSGITAIIRNLLIGCIRKAITFANNVAAATSPRSMATIASARTNVRPDFATSRKWTRSRGNASFAAPPSGQTSTAGRKPAAGDATTRCLAVTNENERSDVYCLEVPSTEAFTVGPGVIAHNCRYLCGTGIDLATQRPADQWPGHAGALPISKSRHTSEYSPMASLWDPRPQQPQGGQRPNSWMPFKG